jgi:hypothetical protein
MPPIIAPIVVEGRLWVVITAGSTNPEALPPGMAFRLANCSRRLQRRSERLLGTDLAGMARYESDDTVTILATDGAHPLVPGPWPAPSRLSGDPGSTGVPLFVPPTP